MADNGLDRPVIGAIFDGTGYGTDGTIWGGEFLVGDYRGVERAGHLARFRLPGGDRSVQEPWRVAVGLLGQHWGLAAAELPLAVIGNRDRFAVDLILRMTARGIHSPITSSMGRLFDAVSAILGVCEVVEYEAQAAIELEALLDDDEGPLDPWPLRLSRADDGIVVEHEPWLRTLVSDVLDSRLPAARISRRLHDSVVQATTEVCLQLSRTYGISDVVLSGGVFLNMYLLVRIEQELSEAGLRVHTHNRVPTSDGGLAVGQAMVAAARVRERTAAGLSMAGG
jgi:hydrogenase maturation protein HypF